MHPSISLSLGAPVTDEEIHSGRPSNLPKVTQLVHCQPPSPLRAGMAAGSYLPGCKWLSNTHIALESQDLPACAWDGCHSEGCEDK